MRPAYLGFGSLSFGISNGAGSFGKLAHTTGMFTNDWVLYTVEFEAQVSGTYLTIHGTEGVGGENSWIHLDAVNLVRVPALGAVGVFAAAAPAGFRRPR